MGFGWNRSAWITGVVVGGELVGVDKQRFWLFGEALGADDGAALAECGGESGNEVVVEVENRDGWGVMIPVDGETHRSGRIKSCHVSIRISSVSSALMRC